MSYRDHIEAQKKYIETKKSRHSWVKMAEDRPGAHMATLPRESAVVLVGDCPGDPYYPTAACFVLF